MGMDTWTVGGGGMGMNALAVGGGGMGMNFWAVGGGGHKRTKRDKHGRSIGDHRREKNEAQ
eukprot:scaffold61219_cov38-Tisochrysis_lutea.AAC.2